MTLRLLALAACLMISVHGNAQSPAQPPTESPNHSPGPDDARLHGLMDRVWEFELNEFPMLTTDVGDPRHQDRLGNNKISDFERRDQMRKAFLLELDAIDSGGLKPSDGVDYELLKLRLSEPLVDHQFGLHFMPINNREGFHISLPELPREMDPTSLADFDNYISRLNDVPRFVDEQIELLKQGIERDLVQPAIIMRDSVSQARAHVVTEAKDSLFLTNLNQEAIAKLPADRWNEIRVRIEQAIMESVVPAYERFATFLEETYVPACRGTIAARALPDGRELYQSQIAKFTTLDYTPEQLHQKGIAENARIRTEMEAIREKLAFDGDLPSFLEHLRTDPKFYAKTPEELLQSAALILKRIDGRLPELFDRLPRIPYGIREIPAYVAPQTTSAYYWPPPTDGTRGGFYYLNTYNLSARPLYQLEALSAHEAVPGHHLQLALQAELDGLHPIRRRSHFTAFIEGWALYSERLGKEIGLYQDPYQDFGRLSMEAWRASRLVVDTGIHAMGWTRQQAIQYMSENTALSQHNVVAEVDRYIGWPGQALGYKVGELFITDLRRQAEEALGDRFDVRQFHDMLLRSGSISLPVLEDQFQQYLADSRANMAKSIPVAQSPDGGKAAEASKTDRFDPVVREIEGWTIHIDPALLGESSEADDRSLVMLANHLQRISILVPPETLTKLKQIELWIEKNHPTLGAMQYHPSRGWLLANDHDERLTQKVHIPHADQLLSKEQMLKHPAVILHELAHAYHDQFLSFDHPEVIAVFEKAKSSKTYEDVLLYTGRNVRHYGLNNHKEYFAEGTEAYFYRNDFYPFVRAELKQHDPDLHDLLQRLWGD
ncbi:DUF885 family protein [Neorhodopirellula pilleata]|uniref:DUF885 domain-containing protein n=1 Tax=Neorhodopirellula pilleata TaxID=2714738 RepID=A0A5C6ANG8_9BACT|nr:DUF885 family protein [Neorhodopirellula pilleata]TWU01583.1 hypothetical protein Pla100_13180 [Neorhodopirellula pilleata]